MKRIALIGIIAMLTILNITDTAPAYTVVMDAAQYDRDGQPLKYQTVLPIIDNSEGSTDLEHVQFQIQVYSGEINTVSTFGWDGVPVDGQVNPWLGLPGFADVQYKDGRRYQQAVAWHMTTHTWGPVWTVTGDGIDEEEPITLMDVVPAGLVWAAPVYLGNVELFPEIVPAAGEYGAEGVAGVNGESIAVSDADRRPQLVVPDASTIALLTASAPALLARIRRND